MVQIPDAPWVQETGRTGYCSSGWWNCPPEKRDKWDDYPDEDFWEEGDDGDVFYGNCTEEF